MNYTSVSMYPVTKYIEFNFYFFFFQAEDGIRDLTVTGVQTCALPILGKTNLRHPKNLSCVWIFHSGPGGESADIDVISLRRIRTHDHAFLAWYGNSIGHIPFCFCRRRG